MRGLPTATPAVAVACLLACGCGGSTVPTMAGGKPVGHWVDELKSPDPKHRKEAVEKLGNVGPADPAAFPAVCGALKDPDPRVRREAILAVVKFGPSAGQAAPSLTELSRADPDKGVREYATRALDRIKSTGAGGP